MQILEATYFSKKLPEDNKDDTVMREGVIIGGDAKKLSSQFIAAIAQHRFWEREKPRKVPA
jgi:catalase